MSQNLGVAVIWDDHENKLREVWQTPNLLRLTASCPSCGTISSALESFSTFNIDSAMPGDNPYLHINFERDPLIRPSDKLPKARILVIGGGIIGLSTAWTLLDSGYSVTILAKQYANRDGDRLTSQIAGALWEFPPAVCGHTSDNAALDISKRWSMVSYHVYKYMAADPPLARDYSVQMRDTVFFFEKSIDDDPAQLRKMREIECSGVAGFRRDKRVIHSLGLDEAKYVDAYEIRSPLIDTDAALVRITELVKSKGATLVQGEITGDLLQQEDELLSKYPADAIVNASGLGARELAADENVYPLRGAVLRVLNDGQKFPKIDKALLVSATTNEHVRTDFIFIIPRNDGILYVGGFSEPDEKARVDLHDPMITAMADSAKDFLRELDTDHRDSAYPLAQGLRPARIGDVRCEREPRPRPGSESRSSVVHCYGHAGAGWSLCFGAALEVKALVEEVLAEKPSS